MSGEINVSLRINADGSGLTAVLRTAQGDIKNLGTAAKQAAAEVNSSMDGASSSVRNLAAELKAAEKSGGTLARSFKVELEQAANSTAGLFTKADAAIVAGTTAATAATNGLKFATAGVTRELAVMTGEALRGNYNRLIGSTTVLANRTGILQSLMTPLGATFIAIGVGVGALIYKTLQANESFTKFNNTAELTGSATAHTGTQLRDLSLDLQEMGVKAKDADGAILALANSGKFVGSTFDTIAREAATFAELTGEKITAAVKEFEKLGTDPIKALLELNEKTHAVESSTIQLVATLQAEGNTFAATTIAAQALAEPLDKAKKSADELAKTHSFWETFKISLAGAAEAEAGLADNLLVERDAANKAREAQERLTQARGIIGNEVSNSVNSIIEALTKEKEKLDQINATYGKGKTGLAEYTIAKAEAAIKSVALAAAEQTFFEELRNGVGFLAAARDAYGAYNAALDSAKNALAGVEAGLLKSAKAADSTIAVHKHTAEKVEDAYLHMEEVITSIAEKSADALTKAHEQAAQGAHRLELAFIAEEKAGVPLVTRLAQLQLGIKYVGDAFDATVGKIKTSDTVLAELNRKLDEDVRLAGLSADAKELDRQRQEALNEAIKYHIALTPQFVAAIDASVSAHYRDKQAAEADRAALKDWQQIATSGFDSVGTAIANLAVSGFSKWSDFGKALVADTKQFIAQVIAEFLKLLVFNGIINSLFHTSLPTGLGSLGGIGGGGLGGVGGIGGGLSSLWGGSGVAGSNLFGASSLTTNADGMASGMAYNPSMLGNILGIVGGIYAGYNEFKAAGGGAAGIAGGVAYGLGTLTAAGAVGGIATGAGAAAGAAGGLGAVGLGAIPIVGWVALAAMAINMISGGKLFGTSYKPTGQSTTSLAIGEDGAAFSNTYQEKKQKALFGGTKYKDVAVGATADQNDYAAQIDAQLLKIRQASADALGNTIADIVQGSFKQVMDKSGKVTSEISTVLGKTYKEPIDKFIERIQAENVIAQIDAATGGKEASEVADQYRANADALAQAAQFLLAAEVDVKHGMSLLGDDTSPKDIAAEVSKLGLDGESLIQTYARLQIESGNVKAIFDNLGITTNKTGKDFVEFADDLVKAAGGLQNLNAEWDAYYAAYYSDSERAAKALDSLQKATSDALTGIGLTTDTTKAQFSDAFNAYLAGSPTADGIQKWLTAGLLLDQFTGAIAASGNAALDAAAKLAEAQGKYNDFSHDLAVQAGVLTQYQAARAEIDKQEQENIAQANALAVAAGLQGASEADLANIHLIAANAAAQALADLQSATVSLIDTLGLTEDTAKVADSAAGSFRNVAHSASQAGEAAQALYSAQVSAIKAVKQFLDATLLNTAITTLTPAQRLLAAQSIYENTLSGAKAGNTDDLGNLTKAAQDYLTAAREFHSSGDQYTAIFDAVRNGLAAFANQQISNPGGTGSGDIGGVITDSGHSVVAAVDRNALQTQINLQKLIDNLHDLLGAQKDVSFADLVKQLGLNVPKLLTALGIDIKKETVDTTLQLVTLAQRLGVSLKDVSDSVGFKIGDLRNANSLDSQALNQTLLGIPQADADKVSGYLHEIRDAATDADANAAIRTLTDFVNTLPEGEKAKLAPYLDGIVRNTQSVVLQSDPLGQLALGTFSGIGNIDVSSEWIRKAAEDTAEILKSGTIRVAVVSGSLATGTNTAGSSFASSGDSLAVSTTSRPIYSRTQPQGNDDVIAELRKVREELSALRKERATDDRTPRKLDALADRLATVGNAQAKAIDRQTDAMKVGRR